MSTRGDLGKTIGDAKSLVSHILAAQTYSELFQASQTIWDHKPGNLRTRLYAAYLLRLSELSEFKYNWLPWYQNFTIVKDDGVIPANDSWMESWN